MVLGNQGDPMRQEKLMVIPAEATSAGVQNPPLILPTTSLSGTATWRPHRERKLNFNHHTNWSSARGPPPTPDFRDYVIWWFRQNQTDRHGLVVRPRTRPIPIPVPDPCLDSIENSIESVQNLPFTTAPCRLAVPRSQDLPCLAWPPAAERSRRRGTCPS